MSMNCDDLRSLALSIGSLQQYLGNYGTKMPLLVALSPDKHINPLNNAEVIYHSYTITLDITVPSLDILYVGVQLWSESDHSWTAPRAVNVHMKVGPVGRILYERMICEEDR